ncbi:hypothetical protein [Marinospirillum sp.]|uniref:hypothetical protein n=1 Tax=Marinospirillum sp. TaxID=2183934 RepID=UPI003A87F03A
MPSALPQSQLLSTPEDALLITWNARQGELHLRGAFWRPLGLQGLVIGSYARDVACFRLEGDGRRSALALAELPPLPELFTHPAAQPWRDSFPVDWLAAVEDSPCALTLLRLACLHAGAAQEIEACPFLLQATCLDLARRWAEDADYAAALEQPPCQRLAQLGWPQSTALVHFLARLPAQAFPQAESAGWMTFLDQSGLAARLEQGPRLDLAGLKLLIDFPLLGWLPVLYQWRAFSLSEHQTLRRGLSILTRQVEHQGLARCLRALRQMHSLEELMAYEGLRLVE